MKKSKPIWEGEASDIYVIGGGPSLRDFPFHLLKGKASIGCNAAFSLGPDVCPVTFFSDGIWFDRFYYDLVKYGAKGGRVYTHNHRFASCGDSWMFYMMRQVRGLHKDSIGYNQNSGASAINLALIFGAKNVFLLGFDCDINDLKNGNTHWHDKSIEDVDSQVYDKFNDGFGVVAKALPEVFPGSKIVNLNTDSKVTAFPTEDWKKHFKLTEKKNGNQNK